MRYAYLYGSEYVNAWRFSFPTGVSGKTTYLVAGEELEDGRQTETVTMILLR